jgi:hypothetical protein
MVTQLFLKHQVMMRQNTIDSLGSVGLDIPRDCREWRLGVMLEHCFERLVGTRRCVLAMVMGQVALLGVLGLASSVFAAERRLEGEFEQFWDCPLSNTLVRKCFVDETTSGVLTIGKKAVPIVNTITVRGGMTRAAPETREETIVAAEDGQTMSKTALGVPGGLLGIVSAGSLPASLRETFDRYVKEGVTGVTLTAELAQPASPGNVSEFDLLLEEETAMRLALKVKLSNPFLGNDCYIGSSSAPIILNLTTGFTSPLAPNKPIQGTSGTLRGFDEDEIVELNGTTFVDNTFTAPAASGCGGSSSAIVDAALDAQLGLPAATGRNTAILVGKLTVASELAVEKHQ